jgi:predicted dienelactone hydrolase
MRGHKLKIQQSENIKRSVFLAVFGFLAITGSIASAANVGFETVQVSNGTEPPLSGGVWYPTTARATEHSLGFFTQTVAIGAPISGHDLPLVVLSHGGGSSYEAHYDTALALARAGFVAAAIDQAGDTYNDQSQVLRLWRRPAQLRRLVSYMLEQWPQHGNLNATHVGAFGFSNGGFTVLVAAGGVPDLDSTVPYCNANPDHDLCRALKQAGVDPHLVVDASHYGFLPPCTPRFANRAPRICTDPPGFNRAAFHRAFDAQVVRLFQTTLR